METVISNPKPYILIGSEEGAQRVGIDENMNLEIKGKSIPLDILWQLGDFVPGSVVEILVGGGHISFFQYTVDAREVYFYFSQQRGKQLNDVNKIKASGVQLSRDKMVAYKRILKLAGYDSVR